MNLKSVITHMAIVALVGTHVIVHAKADPTSGYKEFEGGYLGAHVGYGVANAEFATNGIEIIDSFEGSILAGGHGGYGWQTDQYYAGWELAGGFADITNSRSLAVNGTEWLSGGITRQSGVSLKGRFGYVADESLLLYGLGGVSVVNVEGNAELLNVGSVKADIWYPGLQAGLGLEWFVSDNISVRAQGIYTHYFQIDDPVPGLSDQSYNLDTVAITVGVSWWPGR